MSEAHQVPPTILCVDDLHDNLAIRKFLLEKVGYRVLTATTPYGALKVMASEEVHLVLLDYSFPQCKEDGEWLARQIRSRWSGTKLMMLSGYPEVPESAMKTVDLFWTKGSDPNEFRRAISTLLPASKPPAVSNAVQARNVELRQQSKELLDEARRKINR